MIGRVAAPAGLGRAARHEALAATDLREWWLALALTASGGTHLAVGIQHGLTNFALLSFAAGAAQLVLGARVLESRSPLPRRAAILLGTTLIALYVVNVTVGLPPLIAHSHVAGTHVLWGVTLAWPGPIDLEGPLAKCAEACAVACAVMIERDRSRL